MAAAQHPGDGYEVPEYEAHASVASLKDRIRQHYEIASDYYYSLWYVKGDINPRKSPGLWATQRYPPLSFPSCDRHWLNRSMNNRAWST